MIVTSKFKRIILQCVVSKSKLKMQFDLDVWQEISDEISDEYYKISSLEVKEAFYKEVLPSLHFNNYGLSDEQISDIKLYTKPVLSPKTPKKRSIPSPRSIGGSPSFYQSRTSSSFVDQMEFIEMDLELSEDHMSPSKPLDPLKASLPDNYNFFIADSEMLEGNTSGELDISDEMDSGLKVTPDSIETSFKELNQEKTPEKENIDINGNLTENRRDSENEKLESSFEMADSDLSEDENSELAEKPKRKSEEAICFPLKKRKIEETNSEISELDRKEDSVPANIKTPKSKNKASLEKNNENLSESRDDEFSFEMASSDLSECESEEHEVPSWEEVSFGKYLELERANNNLSERCREEISNHENDGMEEVTDELDFDGNLRYHSTQVSPHRVEIIQNSLVNVSMSPPLEVLSPEMSAGTPKMDENSPENREVSKNEYSFEMADSDLSEDEESEEKSEEPRIIPIAEALALISKRLNRDGNFH